MPYNPFSKPFGQRLQLQDLDSLVGEVAEGYFMEYKEAFPENRKIAHSIASFANTYGGWYIVGMRTDECHVASSICGYDLKAEHDAIGRVRNIARTRIDPFPLIYLQIVQLDEEKGVLVVHIPGGQRTPFVTYDGKIYRRNHDASDPIPEVRRDALDRLVQQGEEVDREFARLCRVEKEPAPVGDEGLAWLNLYLMPQPLGMTDRTDLWDSQGLDSALEIGRRPITLFSGEDEFKVTGNMPFQHAQLISGGVRLRQISRGSLTGPSVTVELTNRGSARFHVPIFHVPILDFLEGQDPQSSARKVLEDLALRSLDAPRDRDYLRVFSVAELFLQVLVLVGFYTEWLGERDWWPDFRCGFSLSGLWSTVPFVDTEEWAELVERWGPPIISSYIQVPMDWQRPPVLKGPDTSAGFAMEIVEGVAHALGFDWSAAGRSLAGAIAEKGKVQRP